MAKRGRKPKNIKVESYLDYDNEPVKENFLELEEDLLYNLDISEIDRYIRPHRSFNSYGDSDEDSFAFWYGYN